MNYKGKINLLANPNKIAVIGSRNCSWEDRVQAEWVGSYIARNNVLVSGLANGIDTHAALGALINGGVGQIAVVPIFPKILPDNNALLAEDIINNQGLVFAPDSNTDNLRDLYLLRDRVIVDLCKAICIIGDKTKGGTGYTYDYAKKRGKKICLNTDEIEKYINGTSKSSEDKGYVDRKENS